MKRWREWDAVLLLAVVLVFPTTVRAQDSLVVRMNSHQMWRGMHAGQGVTAEMALAVGLAGRARTTLGRAGLSGHVEGIRPISDRDGARLAAEHYGIGAMGYACLDGLRCEWTVNLGIDGHFRPHHPGSDESTTELSLGFLGQTVFQRQGITLSPSVVVRRDSGALDGWMTEVGISNRLGRENTKVLLRGLLRLSDYKGWGMLETAAAEFEVHSGELAATVHHATQLGTRWWVSFSLEVGRAWTDSELGADMCFFRVGTSLLRT